MLFKLPALSGRKQNAQFESLVRAYSSDLYRFAYWLSRDAGHAEDLVQETYFRAWKNLAQLKDFEAAKPWLFTILRREFMRDASKLKPTVQLDDEQWQAIPGLPNMPEVGDAVDKLPADHREAFLLQTLGGFSSEEIASMIGCSSDAVLQRASRARRTLRKWLGHTPPSSGRKVS